MRRKIKEWTARSSGEVNVEDRIKAAAAASQRVAKCSHMTDAKKCEVEVTRRTKVAEKNREQARR
jgi:hypothetical protein